MAAARKTRWRGQALRVALRLLGPVLLLVVLWRIDDPAALWQTLARAEPWALAAALALNVVVIHLKVVRWQVLLRAAGYRYGTGRGWRALVASLYVGMLTPGRVGDVLRIQYTRHDLGVPYAEGLAVIVMDRLCDMYVLVAFVAAGAARFASVLTGKLGLAMWIGVLLTTVLPLVLFVPGLAERLGGRLYARLSPRRDAAGLERFLAALRAQVSRSLWLAVPLTVAGFAVNYLQGWLIGESLGLGLSWFDAMSLMAVASLLGLLPISVSGVGVRELFMALAFPVIGLAAESGVAFGLVVFAVLYLALILAGFVAWQVAPPPFAPKAAADEEQGPGAGD
ncbi:MAG: flippase-like domain-containing protein [Myxococcales bacterium]|nr:flippase-like domain-containing protein [Myxococcales bacterium]